MENQAIERFLISFQQCLAMIEEPRLFETERGYQGALLCELKNRLADAAFPGDPIVEQEYQKTLPKHGITIRPDLIIHVPFDRGTTPRRDEGNFAAIEIKRRSTAAEAKDDFESLELLKSRLCYPITVFLNIDSQETHADQCPASIAGQTICFAVQLQNGKPHIVMKRSG